MSAARRRSAFIPRIPRTAAIAATAAALIVSAAGSGGPAAAVPSPTAAVPSGSAYWTRYDDNLPLRVYQRAAATDPSGGVVEFGGYVSRTDRSADTWVWDGAWTRRTPAHSPSARSCASMAFDGAGRVILFAGETRDGAGKRVFLDDTWAWDGKRLDPAAADDAPAGPLVRSVASDGAGTLVLYGGWGAGSGSTAGLHDDTWSWSGSTWVHRVPRGAPGKVAYAPAAPLPGGRALLYAASGTWIWDGADWHKDDAPSAPGKRFRRSDGSAGRRRGARVDGAQARPLALDLGRRLGPAGLRRTAERVLLPDAGAHVDGRLVSRTTQSDGETTGRTWVHQPFDGVVHLRSHEARERRGGAGRTFGRRLTVTTTDVRGVRLAGQRVTFALPATGPGARFPRGALSATVTSDAAGVATSPAFVATTAVGTWKATATSGSQRATFAMRTIAAPVTLVATVARNRTVLVRRTDATTWRSLGGNVRGTPALARHPRGPVYYVAEWADGRLYVRTDRLGWRRLTTFACSGPGASFNGAVLEVGCRGSDGYARAFGWAVAAGALPQPTDAAATQRVPVRTADGSAVRTSPVDRSIGWCGSRRPWRRPTSCGGTGAA
jgi:hypothetical protein